MLLLTRVNAIGLQFSTLHAFPPLYIGVMIDWVQTFETCSFVVNLQTMPSTSELTMLRDN